MIILSIKIQQMPASWATKKCIQHMIVIIHTKCHPWLVSTEEIYDASRCEKWGWDKEFLHWYLWNIYQGTFEFLHSYYFVKLKGWWLIAALNTLAEFLSKYFKFWGSKMKQLIMMFCFLSSSWLEWEHFPYIRTGTKCSRAFFHLAL